jgi:pyruvate,water dikinase
MNVGNPQLAFEFAQLPSAGVGLARLEFIINNEIGVHPKACLEYGELPPALKKKLDEKTRGYADPPPSTARSWRRAWRRSRPRSGRSR